MRTSLLFAASTLALVLAGCTQAPPPRPFDVQVRAITDENEPLAGVAVQVEGQNVGITDAAGQVTLRRGEPEGTHLNVVLQAPKGYRQLDDAKPLVLHRINRTVDGTVREVPVEHVARFAAAQRKYAVLVDVGAPNLPVEAFGVRQAVTNSHGVASFTYTGSPGDELAITVSSEGHKELKANVVAQNFVLAPRSEAYLVEGRFEAAPPVVARRHHAAPAPLMRPRRL